MSGRSQEDSQAQQAKCRLAEIVQYRCDAEHTQRGEPQFHCWPIPRIFRICPGRPAVEMTRFVDVDMSTGEISIPPESSPTLPKGKPWRDVIRNDEELSKMSQA